MFENFLKSFFGNDDKKIKTLREINKNIMCLTITKIEYSVPIKE